MANLAEMLSAALTRAGVPIIGVSIGSPDRATWRIDYAPDASSAQRAQGEAIRQSYDPATDAVFKDEQSQQDYNAQLVVQAVAQALWECIPSPTMTKLQLKNRAIALYKALL